MARKSKTSAAQPKVTIDGEVVRQIRQHARSGSKTEVCGVLIGSEERGALTIVACIAGLNAAQAGTHVTFTQDTWQHIYKTKDAKYPDHRIVGWYHSHPGFGVFLSEHDTFIHKNFFSSPFQVAWVYDPLSDEEGCFGWAEKRLERLFEVIITDRRGGEAAGESAKPEPIGTDLDDPKPELEEISDRAGQNPAWLRIIFPVITHSIVLLLALLAAWFLFPPRIVVWPIDSKTGQLTTDKPIDLDTFKQMLSDERAKAKEKGATASPQAPQNSTNEEHHGPR
jgi:proteasome lid subunit RPN8/RPN11